MSQDGMRGRPTKKCAKKRSGWSTLGPMRGLLIASTCTQLLQTFLGEGIIQKRHRGNTTFSAIHARKQRISSSRQREIHVRAGKTKNKSTKASAESQRQISSRRKGRNEASIATNTPHVPPKRMYSTHGPIRHVKKHGAKRQLCFQTASLQASSEPEPPPQQLRHNSVASTRPCLARTWS